MTKRREFTRNQQAQMLHRATNENGQVVCEGCGLVLGKKPYEFDHTIAEELIIDKTRKLTIEDGKLLGVECCHRGPNGKTAQDVKVIAKAKRVEAKHYGFNTKRSHFQRKHPNGQRAASRPIAKWVGWEQ